MLMREMPGRVTKAKPTLENNYLTLKVLNFLNIYVDIEWLDL